VVAGRDLKGEKDMAGNSAVAGQSVVSKLTAILLAFNQGGTHTFTEIAEFTGLALSTTHRLATELVAHQVLERTTDGRLRPGASLRTLAAPPVCDGTVRNTAAAVLDDVANAMGREVRFGTLNHLRVGYLRKVPGCPVSNMTQDATLPIHATALGKILLAFAPAGRLETVISQGLRAYTPHTVTELDHFRYTIILARQRRYATADNELRLNYSAVAVPVFGPGGNPIAAIEMRVDDLARGVPSALPTLKMAAHSISRELGRSACGCPATEAAAMPLPSAMPLHLAMPLHSA
jgi:DNA-binding IclR family transcriptional regulator